MCNQTAWERGRRKGNCQKRLGEGPTEQRSPKNPVHHPKQVLYRCDTSARGLSPPWPKRPLHPPLTTLGNFVLSTPLPGGLVCNARCPRMLARNLEDISSVKSPQNVLVDTRLSRGLSEYLCDFFLCAFSVLKEGPTDHSVVKLLLWRIGRDSCL